MLTWHFLWKAVALCEVKGDGDTSWDQRLVSLGTERYRPETREKAGRRLEPAEASPTLG